MKSRERIKNKLELIVVERLNNLDKSNPKAPINFPNRIIKFPSKVLSKKMLKKECPHPRKRVENHLTSATTGRRMLMPRCKVTTYNRVEVVVLSVHGFGHYSMGVGHHARSCLIAPTSFPSLRASSNLCSPCNSSVKSFFLSNFKDSSRK